MSIGVACVTPVKATATSSPALVAANRRLHALRARVPQRRPPAAPAPTPALPLPGATVAACVAVLPPHLGWDSQSVTAAIRRAQGQERPAPAPTTPVLTPQPAATDGDDEQASPAAPAAVKLFPDIGLALLRQEQSAAGRLWLLLRHLDQKGRGWLAISDVRRQLAHKESPQRLCGWRQLRNLLQQGQGVFWQRDEKRVWLRSTVKVAAALQVPRLAGRPVALPLAVLLAGIGTFRAHLYASFHSGRAGPEGQGMPIARATLTALSGVSRRSQHAYEQRARVQVQYNYAVGETATPQRREARAWQQGRALFELQDRRGRLGRPGRTYLAWQLPNSYRGPLRQLPKGRQKRFNRQLADLFMKGMTGNGKPAIEAASAPAGIVRRYFKRGAAAVGWVSRRSTGDVYWRSAAATGLWHVVSAGVPER